MHSRVVELYPIFTILTFLEYSNEVENMACRMDTMMVRPVGLVGMPATAIVGFNLLY